MTSMLIDASNGLLNWMQPQVASSIGDLAYFVLIYDFIRNEIDNFGFGLLSHVAGVVGAAVLTLLTIWILIQGWRIVTGQSRESMMVLVVNSLRATLIIAAATSMGVASSSLHKLLTNDLQGVITTVVTGDPDTTAEAQIDKSLAYMQLAMSSIDAIQVVGDQTLDAEKTRALWMVGVGTAGPAMTGGALLLMYQVAMALFIGFGPLFILCLLFDQTKQLFSRWLYYGIGTMFSLAVLASMVAIATKVILAVAEAFWATALAGKLMGEDFTGGMTSQAMQQGGIGMLLTLLIITTPPMAASFFQGTLGSFMHFSAFGGGGGGAPIGQRPGESGYRGAYAAHTAPPPSSQRPEGTNAPPTGSPNFGNNAVTNPNYGKSTIQPDQIKDGSRQS